MKSFQCILVLLLSIFMMYCGTDYAEEGQKAYNKKDYTEAIRLLSLAVQEDSANHNFDEMICISYLERGKELFEKTRNLKALQGNFEQAQKFLPTAPSIEFDKLYIDTYLFLAKAYISTRPSSKDEEEMYFDRALSAVKTALELDSTNVTADSLLVSLKESHFQGLIEKGKNFYNKARKTRNPDLYFTAEYYLKEAKKFEADNAQIISLLQKIKEQTLPVLNYRDEVSLAVSGVSRERKAIVMNLSIKNYTSRSVNLELKNFSLVDDTGMIYPINEHEMRKRELFGEVCLTDTILNNINPAASGIIAFDAPSDIEIAYVSYQINNSKMTKKYFR